MPFLATERIGEKRSRTNEGFLICHDVPLARVGEQLYRPEEVPATIKPKPGTDYIRVMRDADELFSPKAIASAEGKPFVVFHPDSMEVTPRNFREVAHGHVQNVRRGTGSDADVLLGDIVVCTEEAIGLIDSGMREISQGYDCGYQELGHEADLPSGLARQHDYIFNHSALVMAGRCGPRCSIGDHSHCDHHPEPEAPMAANTNDRRSLVERLRNAFTNKDTPNFEASLTALTTNDTAGGGADGDGGIVIHNHLAPAPSASALVNDTALADAPPWAKALVTSIDDRFKAVDKALKKVADKKAKDDDDDEEKLKKLRAELEAEEDEEKKTVIRAKIKALTGDARAKDNDDDDEEEKERKRKAAQDNQALLGELELEAPGDLTIDAIKKAVKANDSAFLEDSFTSTVAAAEILAPGIGVPTFDAAKSPRHTFDAICALRRKALDAAMKDPLGVAAIAAVTNGRTLDARAAPCSYIRTVFHSAVAMRKAANGPGAGGVRTADAGNTAGKPPVIRTIADLNAVLKERREPAKA